MSFAYPYLFAPGFFTIGAIYSIKRIREIGLLCGIPPHGVASSLLWSSIYTATRLSVKKLFTQLTNQIGHPYSRSRLIRILCVTVLKAPLISNKRTVTDFP